MDGRWPSSGQQINDNEQQMMMITRHNYEEYFILYMDNELSSDDRRLVETFVQQHPDLKEELDLLLQYKLLPDTDIVFEGKKELMVPIAVGIDGNTPISVTNYEEWMILYLDNELSVKQKLSVEQFIATNPSVNKEFAFLQHTKLQSEEIIFPDKASLFRREEKVRPIPVRWWRVAAAAVFLLGIGITTAIVVNKKSPADEIVKETTPKKKTTTENPVITPKESNSPVNEDVVADNSKQVLTPAINQGSNKNIVVKEKNNTVKNQIPITIPSQIRKEEPVVVSNKPSNDLPQPLYNPNIIKTDATNNAIASDNTPKEIKPQDAVINSDVTTKASQPSDIVNASYTELEQPDGKKNKSRGFFRKIARTFEKRTDIDATDNNRLLVAGLAIKLK